MKYQSLEIFAFDGSVCHAKSATDLPEIADMIAAKYEELGFGMRIWDSEKEEIVRESASVTEAFKAPRRKIRR